MVVIGDAATSVRKQQPATRSIEEDRASSDYFAWSASFVEHWVAGYQVLHGAPPRRRWDFRTYGESLACESASSPAKHSAFERQPAPFRLG
jgi:hypothetical protein